MLQMNGSMVSGIKLRVSYARRQPLIPQQPDGSPATWTTLGRCYVNSLATPTMTSF